MAYTNLGTVSWGSSPTNPITISYDRQRSGADMQYKIKISVAPCTGASYFGYPIYAKIFLGGVQKASTTLKSASPSQWSNAIVYETGWITISSKTSGTTALKVQIYSGSGSSRDSSYSYNLTVDPATSVLGTISNFTLGNAIDIPITKYSSSFTDTLVISLDGKTIKTVSPITNGTDVSFTSAELTNIYSLLPNATKGTFTFKLTTKSGNTIVGTSSDTAEGTIPTSVKPTISKVTVSEENTDVVPSAWGVYVQGKSKLKIVTTASGGSGSSITSVKVTIDSVTYTGSEVTTGLMNNTGERTITVLVTDQRGRSTSTITKVTIIAYSLPYISNIIARRCDENGNANENGEYMKVSIKGGFSSVSEKNSGSYKIQYMKSTDGNWTDYPLSYTGSYYDTDQIISGISTESTYMVRGVVSDYFTEVHKNAQSVSSVFVTVDHLVGGHGIAFGKIAELEDYADFNFKALFRKYLDLANDISVRGKTTDGTTLNMVGMSTSNNSIFGYGGYSNKIGQTNIYGNNIAMFTNGTISGNASFTNTSDKRLKKEIEDIPSVYIDIWKELLPKVFEWNELNNGNGKKQFGLIAQDVIEVFEKYGLDYNDFGLISKFQFENDKTEYFAICYEHYHMMTAYVLKDTLQTIENLKKEIQTLKAV